MLSLGRVDRRIVLNQHVARLAVSPGCREIGRVLGCGAVPARAGSTCSPFSSARISDTVARGTEASNPALSSGDDLGAFAANQAKTFGLEFTYEFGDGRSCDFVISCRTTLAVYTLAREPEPLPEPATATLLGAGILGLLAVRRRSTK